MIGFIVYFVVERFEWYLIAEFGGFLALSFFGEWWGHRKLATARKRSRSDEPLTVSMDENGFDIVGTMGNSHSNWLKIPMPVIRDNGVLLKLSRLSGIRLPDHALIEGSAEDVRKLLAENVTNPALQSGATQ
jgi:hypothetical protein